MIRKMSTFGYAALLFVVLSLVTAAESAATPGFCAFVYLDENCDGEYDEGIEPLLSGWQICYTGSGVGCGVTNSAGSYCKLILPTGDYQVCVTIQSGWLPTSPTCINFTLAAGVIEQLFFGVIPVDHECPQPIGACCFPDGSCRELEEDECAAQGGEYQGDDTLCDPNPCPRPIGACCLEDGQCIETTQAECEAAGGSYQGDGTVCDPNPCTPVPSQESSWGQIKNIYR